MQWAETRPSGWDPALRSHVSRTAGGERGGLRSASPGRSPRARSPFGLPWGGPTRQVRAKGPWRPPSTVPGLDLGDLAPNSRISSSADCRARHLLLPTRGSSPRPRARVGAAGRLPSGPRRQGVSAGAGPWGPVRAAGRGAPRGRLPPLLPLGSERQLHLCPLLRGRQTTLPAPSD